LKLFQRNYEIMCQHALHLTKCAVAAANIETTGYAASECYIGTLLLLTAVGSSPVGLPNS